MEILAQIIDATLEALAERGVVEYDDETQELIGELEIEGSLASDDSMMVWTVKAFGWYVFLWKYSTSDKITAYAADEICQSGDHTSNLPLQNINGQRICVECAGYTKEQIDVVYEVMLRRDIGKTAFAEWKAM